MTPLSIAYIATAAICFLGGLQHLLLALRVEERKMQLLFAIAAFAVAGDALLERSVLSSVTAEGFLPGMPWTALCIATTIIALSWYIFLRTGAARRWLLWTVTSLAGLTVILDFAVGIAYTGPVELAVVDLPWGEQVARVSGATNPLRVVGDLVLIGFLLVLLDTTVRMVRRGEKRQARLLGGSLAVYALALLSIIPVDIGWIALPSPHTFAFLFIVAAMSWDLSEDLIRAARLSREVVANERRWRQLLDDVHLLAARIDRQGRVVEVNPHFTRVMGFTTADAAGREYWDFVTPESRDDRRAAFSRAMYGDLTLVV